MPDHMRRYESLLYNFGTTYRNDYRYGEVKPLVKTTYKVKKARPRPKYVPLKDLQALTAWNDPSVPFNLYHKPEPILQTNPHIVQKRYEKLPDVNRAEIQKTRPKVIMTPAVDLDAVEDSKRQIFLDHIYVSVGEKALREAVPRDKVNAKAPLPEVYAPNEGRAVVTPLCVSGVAHGIRVVGQKAAENPHRTDKDFLAFQTTTLEKPPDVDRAVVQKTRPKVIMTPAVDIDGVEEPSRQKIVDFTYVSVGEKALREGVRKRSPDVRAPLSDVYAPSNPVKIKPLMEPYVSPEWRMDSITWDGKQMRTEADPTKTFWLTRPLSYCPVCESEANRYAMKKRKHH